jgi:glycosyltransferase involved in cell wall biosynthesis
MSSDSNLRGRRAWWKQAAKNVLVRHFYRRVDGAFFMNDNNRAYHEFYGMPAERLFPAAMPIDRARLLAAVPDREAARRDVRREHGIPDDAFVVVQCAKYLGKKRPLDVVRACWEANAAGLPVWSLLVGEGPERAAIEAFVAREGVTNAVLTGFVNQSKIGSYYAASDAVALASDYEPHGVVVAEGAAFGLPVVASDMVGCVGPSGAARPGVNAIAYPCGDVSRLRDAVETLARDRGLYARMSAESSRISETQDAGPTARNYAHAARELVRLGRR